MKQADVQWCKQNNKLILYHGLFYLSLKSPFHKPKDTSSSKRCDRFRNQGEVTEGEVNDYVPFVATSVALTL